MNNILSAVANGLKDKGFDLIKPFQVKWLVIIYFRRSIILKTYSCKNFGF